jgi:uncharacterized protein (TIGR03067 family)
MSLSSILILGATLVPVAAEEPSKEVKAELELLKGSWVLVSRELDGRKDDEKDVKLIYGELDIKGDRFTYKSLGDKVARQGRFKIDPTANPKKLEWTPASGETKDKILAIYKLEGDRLTICAGTPEKRPEAFTTKRGDRQVLVVYERQKK